MCDQSNGFHFRIPESLSKDRGEPQVHGQQQALSEIERVLKNDGLTVYEGMNWDWEYKVSSYWTFFTHTSDGHFCFRG